MKTGSHCCPGFIFLFLFSARDSIQSLAPSTAQLHSQHLYLFLVVSVLRGSRWVARAGCELLLLLPLPSECWGYRRAPPSCALQSFQNFFASFNSFSFFIRNSFAIGVWVSLLTVSSVIELLCPPPTHLFPLETGSRYVAWLAWSSL